MCMRKIVKNNSYLHRVCPLGKTQPPFGFFIVFFKSAEKVQVLLVRRE